MSTATRAAASTAAISATDALADYRIAYLSRQLSLIARREVHTGRAKFGAFGDGKEVAQVALARAFRPGDWRAGYYRDQTLMLALGLLQPTAYFAQIYAHTDVNAEPATGGRSMLGHYGGRLLDEEGRWRAQHDRYNSSADISPTAGQMPRLVGLAYASRLYRALPDLHQLTTFSNQGNEVAFGIIGNASCAEGMFWEALNAIGVLQAPAVISIWDDGYGISVPNDLQLMGGDLSTLLAGFERPAADAPGYDLYRVHGWDYAALVATYAQAAELARTGHVPAIVHVVEMTQPQGHSTSGSHERYKPAERLAFEQDHDCIDRMRAWLLAQKLADARLLDELEREVREQALAACDAAWQAYTAPALAETDELCALLVRAAATAPNRSRIEALIDKVRSQPTPLRRPRLEAAHQALLELGQTSTPVGSELATWAARIYQAGRARYARHLHDESASSPLHIPAVPPAYAETAAEVRGYELLQANFDAILARDPRVFIFGEDVGRLGDVNHGVAGLQEKYGALRVADTGIRETTIVGQALGMALRGLRPIAEIQYLDYVLYALPTLSDDLATLRWRTDGGHKAPVIIRTRGHRLEGIWHSGSPMATLLNLLRGMHLLVPRNMTQAAGFYNTLLRGDDPALVIETLNAYRLQEQLPQNLGEFTTPLGVPEVIRAGDDLTLVTYGACCRIALDAATLLAAVGIAVEVIDVQTLLPFDVEQRILTSLKRTGRLVCLDEDTPGGASAYLQQQILEAQGGYWWLDSAPLTICSQPHRPAYGTDGDYFSKPNVEDVFAGVYNLMHEAEPQRYPLISPAFPAP